jgi:hypothetical protein
VGAGFGSSGFFRDGAGEGTAGRDFEVRGDDREEDDARDDDDEDDDRLAFKLFAPFVRLVARDFGFAASAFSRRKAMRNHERPSPFAWG